MYNMPHAAGLLWHFRPTAKKLSLLPPYKKNHKFIIVLLTTCFAVCFWELPALAKYGGGSGSSEDPYLIYTAEQFNTIGANSTDWDKHFKMMNDIDLITLTESPFNLIGEWDGLGSFDNKPFSGIFDGNGKTISNFSYTSTSGYGVGLFRYVSGRIKNLGLINPNIVAPDWNIGALVGYLDEGTVIDCYVKGADISGGNAVGGLVGFNEGTIINCYSSGRVSGDLYIGGLTGLVESGTVMNSFSKADVSGNQNVGGLVGMTGDESSTISNCYATGSVTGQTNVGGLAGQVERGGLAKCYSTGSVSGNQYVGGLIGRVRLAVNIWNCFWDIQASGQPTSADGTGKTTAEMQTVSTFAGWDFFAIWTICEETNYPVLLWQIRPADLRCPDGVDMTDFAWFAQQWKQSNCSDITGFCGGTDFDESGSVNFFDLSIFANDWLAGL